MKKTISILFFIFACQIVTSFAQVNLNDGLVAYYPFNGNASDESGNGNDGTVNGATLTVDHNGNENNAYQFDAIGDQIFTSQVSWSAIGTGDFTIGAWVFPTVLVGDYRMIVVDNVFPDNFQLNFEQSGGYMQTYLGGTLACNSNTFPFVTSEWYYVLVTRQNSMLKFYINGQLSGSTFSNQSVQLSSYIQIGYRVTGEHHQFYGTIDEVRIYNRSLSEAEIQVLYSENTSYLSINVTKTDITCNGDSNGTIDVSASGGTSPYSYLWSNAVTTPSLSGLAPGTYSLTVTDMNDSIATVSYSITQPDALEPVTSVNGNSVELAVTGGISPYTYLWSEGSTTTYLTEVNAGSYIVTITDGNGCTAIASAIVTTNLTIDLNDGLVAYYPFNGNANDESGNGHNGTAIGAELTSDRCGDQNKAYYFDGLTDYIVADATGLPAAERTVSLWFYANEVNTGPNQICYGGNGCGTSWLENINQGNGAGNCYQFQSHCVVNRLLVPYSVAPVGEWYNWVITTSADGTNMYIDGEFIGGNSIYVNNTYVESTELAIGVGVDTYGNAPYADVNGGYFNGKLDDIRIYNRKLNSLEILALYNEGCLIPEITATVTNISCYGAMDGSIDISVSGGISPYSYLWSNAATSSSLNNITAGEYYVTLTDNQGWLSYDTVIITQPDSIIVSGTLTDQTCGNNGAINLTVSGGTPFSTTGIPSDSGLVAYYPFNGNANDESGNGNNGNVYGATLVTDRFGNFDNAYSFDGTNDYIFIGQPVPNSLLCENGLSISVWIKPDELPYLWGDIIACQNDFENSGYSLAVNNTCTSGGGVIGGIHFQLMNTLLGYYAPCSAPYGYTNQAVSFSDWTHVVATWSSGNQVKVYFNDTLVGDWIAWNGPISYSAGNILTIGKHDASLNTDGGNNRWFSGLIDDICIYSRALDNTEISNLYNGTYPTYSYLWSTNDTTKDLDSLAAGTYTVTVTDSLGCTATASFNVNDSTVVSSNHIWFVSTTGSDLTGIGTIDQPFATFAHTVGLAAYSDTIYAAPGTYFEIIDYSGKDLFISSYEHLYQDTAYISQTIIDGSGNNPGVKLISGESEATVLNGFRITNCYPTGIRCDYSAATISNCEIDQNQGVLGNGINSTYSHLIVSNCNFNDNHSNDAAAISCWNESDILIENSYFRNNSSTYHGGAISCWYGSTLTVNNSIFTDNHCGYSGGAIDCHYGSSLVMVNALIYGNSAVTEGGAVKLDGCPGTIINSTICNNNSSWDIGDGIYCMNNMEINIINSILFYNQPSNIRFNSGTANIAYTCIEPNTDNNQGSSLFNWSGTNIISNPGFADPVNADYNLSSYSPCIGAGIDTIIINSISYSAPGNDIVYNSRPSPPGSNPDLGAYESILNTALFSCGTSNINDYDGNTYNTVQIGNQCWMKENLKTTHYSDGTSLVDGTGAGDITGNYTTKYWFVYDNSLSNKTTYGLLYTWAAVMNDSASSSTNPSGVQGVCPAGWHVPSDAEWQQMEMFLGMSQSQANAIGWGGTTEGGKLKEAGTIHWTSPNTGADNSSGFTALPGGYRNYLGTSDNLSYNGFWWSATESGALLAWAYRLGCSDARVDRGYNDESYGFSVRCLSDISLQVSIPTVITDSIIAITQITATGGGEVTSNGGATVTARGVCWNSTGSPIISDNLTTDSSGTGTFISYLTGLSASTTYFMRAYATNSVGTAYGNEIQFTTADSVFTCGTTTIYDYDSNIYNTIQIGSQCWMKENLKTTHYSDGTALVDGTNAGSLEWSYPTKYWFVYDNDLSNKATYGLLYTWEAVMNGQANSNTNPSGVQGICPDGWHIPSDIEWMQLEMFLGMTQSQVNGAGWRGTDEGGKLKEAGTTHWISPNTGADNSSGFTALPGGYRSIFGPFLSIGSTGYWWTSYDANYALYRYMGNDNSLVNRNNYLGYSHGLSVRCVYDTCTTLLPVGLLIEPSSSTPCTETPVTYMATSVNEGPGPVYQWNVNGTAVGTNSPAYTYIPTDNDVVSCTITSNNACLTVNPATSSETVTMPYTLLVNAIVTDETCPGSGSVDFTVTGAITPYVYLWSNSATTEDIDSLAAGTYSVTVSDANNCIMSASYTVGQPIPFSVSVTGINPTSGNNGIVDVTIISGTSPYNYLWSNGATTEDITGLGIGTYIVTITVGGLCNTTAFATLQPGNLNCGTSTVTDFDNNIYNTVPIGSQCWTKENLKSTHYHNGTALVDGTGTGSISSASTTEYWFVYDNNLTNKATYGLLYTWPAAVHLEGGSANTFQGICPDGWHLPSDLEWMDMEMFLGMTQGLDLDQWRGTTEGGRLKEAGTVHWASPNTGADNSSGFTALPGGYRSSSGAYTGKDSVGFWWTSSNGNYPYYRGLEYDMSSIYRWNYYGAASGFSVRCVFDTCLSTVPLGLNLSSTPDLLCGAQPVTYTATPVNGGINIFYQWSVNGSAAGSNSPQFAYTPSDNDVVSCTITSGASCVTGNPATSTDIVTITDAISISGDVTDQSCGSNGAINLSVIGGAPFTSSVLLPDSGLIAYYPFNGNANDITGNGHDGTVYGPVLCPGRFNSQNSAYHYLTKYDVIDISDINIPIISVSLWYKYEGNANYWSSLLCWDNAWYHHHAQINPEGCLGISNGPFYCSGIYPVYGEWYHIAVTMGAENSKLYLNGNLVLTAPAFDNTQFPLSRFGNMGVETNQGALGVMDDIRIYDRVLNINEINELFNDNPTYTYLWSNGSTEMNIDSLAAGTYTVTVTDSLGCSITESFTVSGYSPQVSVSVISDPPGAACAGTSVSFTATTVNGGSSPSYQWKVNGINAGSDISSYTYIPENGDTVTCILTSSDNCVAGNPATSSITVSQPDQMTISGTVTDQTCGNNGAINLTVTGGIPFYISGPTPLGLNQGLVAYYPFNGNANDESWNGNNGSAGGVTLTEDRFGNENSAYSFDGLDDEIVVANSSSLNLYSISISCWVKPKTLSCFDTFIAKGGNASGYGCTAQYELYYCNLFRYLSSDGYEPNYQFSSNNPLDTSIWQHLVITHSGTTIKFYKNGSLECSTLSGHPFASPNLYNLYIGTEVSHRSDVFFFGALDDIRIYNRLLDNAEISVLYTGTFPSYSYLWSNGATTEYLDSLTAGTYTVTVTDSLGCSTTASYIVTQAVQLSATATGTNPTGGNNGSVDLSVTGGTTPYTFLWSNGDTTEDITGLSPQTYFVSVADNNSCMVTAFVTLISESFTCVTSTVNDFDNNTYNTVQIGNQCWMKENLKTTHYSDGTVLVDGTSAGNISGNYTTKYWFVYNNDISNKATYGLLYTWAAIMNGAVSSSANPSGIQGVCPTGWHVPSDAELKQPEMFLGMSQSQADATGWRGTTEGGKLKEAGATHWASPNTGADNSSGFTALPCGSRSVGGTFYGLSVGGAWWSATEYDASDAWVHSVEYNCAQVYRDGLYPKSDGFSIRCLKDILELTFTVENTDVSCNNNSDGSITLTVTSGSSPYSFTWNSGETTSSLNNLAAGVYYVTVTDNQGLLTSDSILISQPGAITIYGNVTDQTCGNNGAINLTITEGIPVDSGLVAYYPFNSNANDESGNGHNGIVSGAVLTTDRCGISNNAYSFDGVDDEITIADSADLRFNNGDFTIAAWIYPTSASLSNGFYPIITKYAADCGSWLFRLTNNNESTVVPTVNFETACPFVRYYGNSVISLNQWHQVAVTRSSGLNCTLYLDGLIVGTFTNGSNFNSVCNIIISGQGAMVGPPAIERFTGKIDDIRLYNRALETAEILDIYNGICPLYTYLWSNGATTEDIDNLTTGTYIVTVSNLPGCTTTASFTVNGAIPVVSVSITANPAGDVCAGIPVSYIAIPENGGSSPSYQWQVNGSNVGSNSSIYTYFPEDGDEVSCVMTSDDPCTTGSTATSNAITMTVNQLLPIDVSIEQTHGGQCEGELHEYIAISSNEGLNPFFQWYCNGMIMTGFSEITFSCGPMNNDTVFCILTSSESCVSGNPDTSNYIIYPYLYPVVVPHVTITASSDTVCEGTQVIYSAIPVNGGTNTTYQWKVNGVYTGSPDSVFYYTPSNNDTIICELYISNPCATGNPAVSDPLIMTVDPLLPVSISVEVSANPVCSGTSVTFTATPTNGGSSSVYQWKVNGNNVGTNSPTYSYIPSNTDVVTCVLTSNATCPTGNPATSSTITMTVDPTQTSLINEDFESYSVGSFPSNGGWILLHNGAGNSYQTVTNTYHHNGSKCMTLTGMSWLAAHMYKPIPSTPIIYTELWMMASANNTGNAEDMGRFQLYDLYSSNEFPGVYFYSTTNIIKCHIGNSTSSLISFNPNQWYKFKMKFDLNSHYIDVWIDDSLVISNLQDALFSSSYDCFMLGAEHGNTTFYFDDIKVTDYDPLLQVSVSIGVSTNPVCEGTSVTYTATPVNGGTNPAYQWKVNGSNAGSNSSTYSYIPANGDVVICVLTSNATCASGNPATSNVIMMVVDPLLPISISIGASANPVCDGASVAYTVTSVNEGSSPFYQWKVNGSNVGTNSPTYSYVPANGDVVTCVLTSNAICATGSPATSNVITMIVNPLLPVSISVEASANPVCNGTSVAYTVTSVNEGSSPFYQWKVNGSNVGTNSSTYSYVPANGDVVTCVLTSNATCATGSPVTSNAITMTVNPLMPVSVMIEASSNPICAGTSVTFTSTPTNGGSSPIYQWKVNGSNAGSNSSTYFYVPANGDVVTCMLTSNAPCTSGNPATSNVITMEVDLLLPVSVSVEASANPVCEGTSVIFIATPANGGSSPTYQWKVNGNNIGTNSPTYSYIPANGDVVICVLTSNATCASGSPATSNVITMIVDPLLPVSVTIGVSANPVCEGTSVILSATPAYGGSSPIYQWKVNGNNVGTNSSTYSYVPANGDIVTCILTSNATCTTGSPATSNVITMIVDPLLPVSVTIGVSANPVCEGTSVILSATPANGGSSPTYQWKVNGSNVGTNSPTYSYFPANGDIVTCILTSNATCATGSPATSNVITMIVNPLLPVSISVEASANPVCNGTSVAYTVTSVNEGSSPFYQWKVNGSNVGTNCSTYSYVPANGDVVICVLTSNATCASGNPATSNIITMVVDLLLPVSVSVEASANPVCEGTSVILSATPANGGSSPAFQWKVNGNNVGTNSPTYSYFPANGDVVICVLTSNAPCTSGNPATSNVITMIVDPLLPVSVTIGVSANPVCEGTSVIFIATPANGGSSPFYQWKVNGSNVGTNNSTYSYVPANGDVVICVLTSNATCAIGSPATSNAITMIVDPLLPVSVSIASNPSGAVCTGTSVTFTATSVNGGSNPVYQWKKNGTNVGINSPTYTYIPVNNNVLTCIMTSNAICVTGNPATSNAITMTVNPQLSVNVYIWASSNPVCEGVQVTFSAIPNNGGANPIYQWKVNGNNAGTNSNVFSYTPFNNDVVTCNLTSDMTCTTGSLAMSNAINMLVNPNLPLSVSIMTSNNPVCMGTNLTCTATITNGGVNTYYFWKINGNILGTYPGFTYIPANNDIIICEIYSTGTCVTGSPATSNAITMTVDSLLPVSVSVEASANPVCEGTSVILSTTPANGGSSPTYQWKVNGNNVGTNSPTYSFIPSNTDVVTCVLTSDATCPTGNPATSNFIPMIVDPLLPVSISITSDPPELFCIGTSATFTATFINGGLTPSFQWKVNGINSGSDNPIFTYTPDNGDAISCLLISGLLCTSSNPSTSNTINVAPSFSLSYTSTNVMCNGGNDGSIDLTITGVTGNYIFQWTDGSVNEDLSGLFADNYNVTVTDANSCSIYQSIVVTEPEIIGINALITDVQCFGFENGSIVTSAQGGTSPYIYSWSNGETGFTIVSLSSGTYTLTITDQHGCLTVETFNVTEPAVLNVLYTVTNASCPSCSDGNIDLTVTGGNQPYSYLWSNGANLQNLDSLMPGNYYITISDAFLCNLTTVVTLNINTQTIIFPGGWCMFSTYIIPFNPNITDVFAQVVDNLIIVKNGSGSVYWPEVGVNMINDLTIGQGYLLKHSTLDTIIITGIQVVPEQTPIIVNSGNSILGYLRSSPDSLVAMLGSILNNIIIVKDDVGKVYWPAFNIDIIGNLIPGEGYAIKTNAVCTLTYPPNYINTQKSEVHFLETEYFGRPKNTGNNMTLGIDLTLSHSPEGEALLNTCALAPLAFRRVAGGGAGWINPEIGVFDQAGLLIGSAVVEGNFTAIALWGDDELTPEKDGLYPGEEFTLKIYSPLIAGDSERRVNNKFNPPALRRSGSQVRDVWDIQIDSWLEGDGLYKVNGISIAGSINFVNQVSDRIILYQNIPNPFKGTTTIGFYIPEKLKINLSLFNMPGDLVFLLDLAEYEAGYHTIEFLSDDLMPGVYFYKLETQYGSVVKKMTILK